MTSAPSTQSTRPAPDPAPPAPNDGARFSLTADGPAGDHVDGAWWPRSRRLGEEVSVLVAELHDRLGAVDTVTYHLGEWEDPPRRVGALHLGGYRLQAEGTVDVIANRRRLTLLVIGPDVSEDRAHEALRAAADPTVTDDVATLRAHLHPETARR